MNGGTRVSGFGLNPVGRSETVVLRFLVSEFSNPRFGGAARRKLFKKLILGP